MTEDTYFAPFQEQRPGPGVPSQDLVLRAAGPADTPGLAALKWERHGGDPEAHRRFFAEGLTQGGGRNLLLVAQNGGGLVGYGHAVWSERPPDAPGHGAPSGWYLLGLAVAPAFRRRGIGALLTRRRLQWVSERADEAFYFTNARNRVSIALHRRSGFVELTRDFVFPSVTFSGGVGILYRVDLSEKPPPEWPCVPP